MLQEEVAQWNRRTLVEQDAHLSRSQSAPLCMLQHGAHLF